jgi:hypothetical protein
VAGSDCCSNHAVTKVVLPKPGGAEMSVRGRVNPPFNLSIKRGRATKSVRVGGICSLVLRRGFGMVMTQRPDYTRCAAIFPNFHLIDAAPTWDYNHP